MGISKFKIILAMAGEKRLEEIEVKCLENLECDFELVTSAGPATI